MGFEDLRDDMKINNNDSSFNNKEEKKSIGILIRNFFNRDTFVFGVILGFLLPILGYFVITGLDYLFIPPSNNIEGLRYLRNSTVIVISIFLNLFPFRYYMINKKYDRTGRGILFDTFIMTIAFFILENYL